MHIFPGKRGSVNAFGEFFMRISWAARSGGKREREINVELANLQKQIAQALSDPKLKVAGVLASQPLDAIERLAIYRNSANAALTTVLGSTYRVCQQLVGNDFFEAMANIYVRKTPALSPDIEDYGASFAEFIREFPHAQSLPYLADVATLEWAWHLASRAPHHLPLEATALAQVATIEYENIVFTLPAECTLISSPYPILQIWQFHQSDYRGDSTIDLQQGENKLLVWRQQLTVRCDALTVQQWQLLSAIAKKCSVGELCTVFGEDIITLLSEIMGLGWLSGFFVRRVDPIYADLS